MKSRNTDTADTMARMNTAMVTIGTTTTVALGIGAIIIITTTIELKRASGRALAGPEDLNAILPARRRQHVGFVICQ